MTVATRKLEHNYMATKMGAILGLGLMDAGGRNATLSLMSSAGQKRMNAIVGAAVFWLGLWYWHPLIPFVSLCFRPTMLVGLNKDLKMPKTTFKSDAPPSLFAYPEKLKEYSKKDKKTNFKKAVLSITLQDKARRKQKKSEKGGEEKKEDKKEEMDTDKPEEKKEEEKEESKKEAKEEPKFEMLENPSRVTLMQEKGITFTDS